MTNLSREFCQRLRQARREAGLTQSELAREVGCKQSALSMFEQGDGTKLNDETIKRLATRFNLELPSHETSHTSQTSHTSLILHPATGYCPNPHCPSNHVYQVQELTLYRIDRQAADPVGGRYCALCGELLERACPNCGAPVHEGAVCSLCGEPYVR